MNPEITQFDEIIQFALKKLLMLIYVITILNIAVITLITIKLDLEILLLYQADPDNN
jgi:hypothetical protein